MTDYVPTTEQVRERYILPAHRINHEERGEEFDCWHAEEIQKAKAEALRECADTLAAVPDYAPSEYDRGRVGQRLMTIEELLVRADQIEEG